MSLWKNPVQCGHSPLAVTVALLILLLFRVFLSCDSVIAMLFCDCSLCNHSILWNHLSFVVPSNAKYTGFLCFLFFEHFLMYWKSKFDCRLITLLELKSYFHNLSKIITQLWINMNKWYLINSLCDKRRHQFTICCS